MRAIAIFIAAIAVIRLSRRVRRRVFAGRRRVDASFGQFTLGAIEIGSTRNRKRTLGTILLLF